MAALALVALALLGITLVARVNVCVSERETTAASEAGSEQDTASASQDGAVRGNGQDSEPTVGDDGGNQIEAVAREALVGYQGAGDCVLAYAGYLDLLGNVWSCVVVGDGWSEICLVSRGGDEDAPHMRVIRIEGEDLVVSEEGR